MMRCIIYLPEISMFDLPFLLEASALVPFAFMALAGLIAGGVACKAPAGWRLFLCLSVLGVLATLVSLILQLGKNVSVESLGVIGLAASLPGAWLALLVQSLGVAICKVRRGSCAL